LLVLIPFIVSVLCLKNVYDAVHYYSALHAALSSTPPINTEIDLETAIETEITMKRKSKTAGVRMTNIGQISGAIEEGGAKINNAQQKNDRPDVLASGSDIV